MVFKAGMEVILDLAISCDASLHLPLCLGALIALLLLLALTP